MLERDTTEPSESSLAFPCVLVPKIDDFIRYCINYRKVTEQAKEKSAFVSPDGPYQYKVMPFCMKNSQPTFQTLITMCLKVLEGVEVYVDDIVIFVERTFKKA